LSKFSNKKNGMYIKEETSSKIHCFSYETLLITC